MAIPILNHMDFQKSAEIQNVLLHTTGSTDVTSPGTGQIIYDSGSVKVYNGSNWLTLASGGGTRTVAIDTNGDGSVNNTLELSEDLVLKKGSGVSLSEAGGVVTISATGTQLTQEEVEDYVGGMLDGTETGISVSYDDTNGNLDFVIGAGAIVNSMLADDAVGADELAADAVVTASIVDANVTTAKIADANVTTAKIADGAVTTAKLGADSVTAAKIGDDVIDSEHIAAGAIDTEHIAADQVTYAKIQNVATANRVLGSTSADGIISEVQVATAMIADNAVTTAKITDANVTTAKLADNAVTTAKITDANVTTAKIADDAVTGAKIPDDAIDSEHYADGSIDTAHIANDAVTGDKLANSITIAENLTVTGNLTVSGDTVTANVGTLDVEDKNITVNKSSGDSSSTADGAGITIQDAVDADNDASLTWNAAGDKFVFSHPVDVTGILTATGTSVFANLDISGDVDVDGTLETDALTIGGTAIAEVINDRIGAVITAGEGIDVTNDDSANTVTIDAEDSSATNKGIVIVAAGDHIDVSYSNGTATIAAEQATAINEGVVELATAAEVRAGSDQSRVITPDTLAAKSVVATILTASLNATQLSAVINHGLGTTDLLVTAQLKNEDSATDYGNCIIDWECTSDGSTDSDDNIYVKFAAAPPSDVEVNITSIKGATAVTPTYPTS